MALAMVEVEEDRERRLDPESWQEARDKEIEEFYRETPGILARVREDEPEGPADEHDGEAE
jgi:hypothetical protein